MRRLLCPSPTYGRNPLQHVTSAPCLPREEISQARLNTIRGIENLDRLDESLYQDFETEDMRKVLLP